MRIDKPGSALIRGIMSPAILLAGIADYKHPGVVRKLMQNHGMSQEDAEELFEDTKRFLYICGTNPDGSYGPSHEIDKGWHEFLMFTQDYRNFCTQLFGRFIDHRPNMPDEAVDRKRPRRTLQAAAEIFGAANLSRNWAYQSASGELKTPAVILANEAGYTVEGPCDSCGCSPCE
ncbi:MAG TPA: hypothetical protein VD967_00725 [Candidatus Paceibacterota bacterium]|nr:hypothetical protein [Candidatus Paceibacterota bacterium]